MRSRPAALLAVVCLVVLAGCTVPLADDADAPGTGVDDPEVDDPDAPEVDDPDVDDPDANGPTADGASDGEPALNLSEEERERLRNDELPTDEVLVYERVATMLDSDAPPPTVEARDLSDQFDGLFDHPEDPRFQRLNLTETTFDDGGVAGVAYPERVVLQQGEGDETTVEIVLAHEFAHTIQFHEGMIDVSPRIPGWEGTEHDLDTTDAGLAETALIEGGAMYVEDEYADRHLDDLDRPSARMDSSYRESTPGMRYVYAPYAFGVEYVHATVDDPADLESVYVDDPPVTTHGIMYPDEGVGEPADVAVDAEAPADDVEVERTDRMGAAFLHVTLGSELSEDEAHEATRAWREDRLVEFGTDDGDRPFVWAIRLDDAESADRVAEAVERTVDERTDEHADEFAIERVGDRTLAVISGDEQFRDRVEVAADDDAIAVTVGDDHGAPPTASASAVGQPAFVAT